MTKLLAQMLAKVGNLPDEKQDAIAAMVLSEINSEEMRSFSRSHGVLDIPPISVGKIIQLPQPDDDLLGEMLETRL